jgi:hypothetical protein
MEGRIVSQKKNLSERITAELTLMFPILGILKKQLIAINQWCNT